MCLENWFQGFSCAVALGMGDTPPAGKNKSRSPTVPSHISRNHSLGHFAISQGSPTEKVREQKKCFSFEKKNCTFEDHVFTFLEHILTFPTQTCRPFRWNKQFGHGEMLKQVLHKNEVTFEMLMSKTLVEYILANCLKHLAWLLSSQNNPNRQASRLSMHNFFVFQITNS